MIQSPSHQELHVIECIYNARDLSVATSSFWDASTIRWLMFLFAFTIVAGYQYFKWSSNKKTEKKYKQQ